MSSKPELPAHGNLGEPLLLFHPDRLEDHSPHPLVGLTQYGPFSRSLINPVLDPIRLAVIAPHGEMERIRGFVAEFERQHQPRERKVYLPAFTGFRQIFGLRLLLEPSAMLELSADLDDRLHSSSEPHQLLATELVRGLGQLQSQRNAFDIVLIYLPHRWHPAFEGPLGDDFDLHDHVKAVAAMRGIPTQLLLEDRALSYPCRASVMWRQSIALYVKAGGVPWKLASAPADTAYIGLSYSIRPQASAGRRFVVCCSQVFDSDGAGLEFLLYDTGEAVLERENPYLSRPEMRRVMARSLAVYQRRHAGRSPQRVMVHKTSEFKRDEVEGCFDALAAVKEVELVQIKQDVAWRAIKIEKPKLSGKGLPSNYPVERGSFLPLGGREVLLWTQGNAPTAVGGKSYFKEGKGTPSPIELVRFAGHTGWEEVCRSILGLSKMDWNNDNLYDRLPVTIGYAQTLARVVKRMTQLGSRPYEFRFFM
jgi:hypothetical protein